MLNADYTMVHNNLMMIHSTYFVIAFGDDDLVTVPTFEDVLYMRVKRQHLVYHSSGFVSGVDLVAQDCAEERRVSVTVEHRPCHEEVVQVDLWNLSGIDIIVNFIES